MNLTENEINELNIIRDASRKTLLTSIKDDPEEAVLYTLAKEGPLTLAKLTKTIGNYGDWEANHNTIKRRLDSDKSQINLIDFEFVKKREPEKRKPGKYGKIYCLTTKGFLASMATNLSIERTDLFKKYIQFLDKRLDMKIKHVGEDAGFDSTLNPNTKNQLVNIFTNYIKYQMIVFLIWNQAYETSIRKIRKFNWHIEDFCNLHNEFIHQEFPVSLDKKEEERYRQILRKYFHYSKCLHSLMQLEGNDLETKKIKYNLDINSVFVYKWYLYFDQLQMQNPIGVEYNIFGIKSQVISRPEYGIDIEYEGTFGNKKVIQPNIKNETKNKIEQILKKKTSINHIWNKVFDKKMINNEFLY